MTSTTAHMQHCSGGPTKFYKARKIKKYQLERKAKQIMFYIEKTRKSTEKLLELLREFSKVRGDKLNTKKKKMCFYILVTSN